MIVFGGYDGSSYVNTGYVFEPDSNTWQTLATTGDPVGRGMYASIWTGSAMITWGGFTWTGASTGGAATATGGLLTLP